MAAKGSDFSTNERLNRTSRNDPLNQSALCDRNLMARVGRAGSRRTIEAFAVCRTQR